MIYWISLRRASATQGGPLEPPGPGWRYRDMTVAGGWLYIVWEKDQ